MKKSFTFIMLFYFLNGCYFAEHFKTKDNSATQKKQESTALLGQDLGEKAGVINQEELNSLYEITTKIAPAAVRIDPDLYARNLVLRFKEEGTTVAKVISDTEDYRILLGGASQDFQTKPQEIYDATSLLAVYNVAQKICKALITPNQNKHKDWETILPYTPEKVDENIKYLIQKITGIKNNNITEDMVIELKSIVDLEVENSKYKNKNYIGVCAALALDAQSLFL